MIKELEELLYKKTVGKQSEILFAQWNYDKKILPSALNAVSNLFPHYSLHDLTHSETIINNIIRVIGEKNIEKLSAIDIWLILEASYSHDIGMVVSSEKLIEALKSSAFIDFFRDLQEDPKNGLYEFAVKFEIEDKVIKYKEKELSLHFHDAIKFILAEFFRRNHSERSKDIILNPSIELALTTPRGVIPNRIFKILADVCSAHTKDFEDVMKLPFCEVGIDVEDAHPRFIACMLRIGDLLDLDNNRFSEVMLRTLSKIPIDTINHKAKHLSIESFRVDNERIDVLARCTDYDTANIAQHWFNYLDSEISKQMINWNNIVPFKELGYLPTIGELKVDLENYDYIDGKQKPKFSVDTDKALSLLQGAGIYEHDYQAFRELLQNAVDSTLLRIWLEYKNEYDFKSPQDSYFLEKIKEFPIEIRINEGNKSEDLKEWRITIRDQGIGISSDDLKYLMKTGSSSKNRKKRNIIEEMPAWLRPSGIFGIGFQSIFLLTDQVVIETKNFFDEEFKRIELNAPNSVKDGAILIQKQKTDHSVKPGASLIINYQTEAVPSQWSIKGEQENAMRIAHNYDPLSHESLDISLGMIIDEILDFEQASFIPLKLYLDDKPFQFNDKKDGFFKYFEQENSLEFNIYPLEQYGRIRTFYKNQNVKNDFRSFYFVGFDVNIHKEKASEILTLSRNKLKSKSEDSIEQQILESAFKIIIKNFDKIFTNDYTKKLGSLFLEYYRDNIQDSQQYALEKLCQWKNFKIKFNDDSNEIEIQTLLAEIKVLRFNFTSNNLDRKDRYTYNDQKLSIDIDFHAMNSASTAFIFKKLEDRITRIIDFEFKRNEDLDFIEFSFEPNNDEFFPENKYSEILKQANSWNHSSRKIIPCLKKYNTLRLKESARLPYLYHFRFSHYLEFNYPKMVSPFVVEEINHTYPVSFILNDNLYDWVFENRYDPATTREEIIKSYEDFRDEYEVLIQGV